MPISICNNKYIYGSEKKLSDRSYYFGFRLWLGAPIE